MIEFRIEDEFEIDAPGFWRVFFSPAYANALWREIDCGYELVKFEERGEGLTRTIDRVQRLTPRREVPKMVQKFVDGAITYEERNHFRAADSSMSVETVPNFFADKITQEGRFFVEARGPKRCARVYEGRIECRVPMLGKRVEEHLVGEIEASYRRSTAFTRRFLGELAAQ